MPRDARDVQHVRRAARDPERFRSVAHSRVTQASRTCRYPIRLTIFLVDFSTDGLSNVAGAGAYERIAFVLFDGVTNPADRPADSEERDGRARG